MWYDGKVVLRWVQAGHNLDEWGVTVKQPGILISFNPGGISAVSIYSLFSNSYFLSCLDRILIDSNSEVYLIYKKIVLLSFHLSRSKRERRLELGYEPNLA